MTARPASTCDCKVQNGRIVFCALHASAAGLLAACKSVRELLPNCVPDEDEDAKMIRDVILPRLDSVIAKAQGKARKY